MSAPPSPTSSVDVDIDARLTAMGLLVGAFTRVRMAVEHDLEPHGLSGSEFEVLIRIARSPGERLRMSDLAKQIIVSNSGLTRVVDRLSDAGLVERVRDGDDRRVLHACITPAGHALVEATLPDHLARIDQLITGVLAPDELAAFVDALRKVRAAASDALAPTGTPPAP